MEPTNRTHPCRKGSVFDFWIVSFRFRLVPLSTDISFLLTARASPQRRKPKKARELAAATISWSMGSNVWSARTLLTIPQRIGSVMGSRTSLACVPILRLTPVNTVGQRCATEGIVVPMLDVE